MHSIHYFYNMFPTFESYIIEQYVVQIMVLMYVPTYKSWVECSVWMQQLIVRILSWIFYQRMIKIWFHTDFQIENRKFLLSLLALFFYLNEKNFYSLFLVNNKIKTCYVDGFHHTTKFTIFILSKYTDIIVMVELWKHIFSYVYPARAEWIYFREGLI